MTYTGNEPIEKDIIITISNLPPAAYDTLCDKVQIMVADLMRTMGKYKHLLSERSEIKVTYTHSNNINE